MSTDAPSVLANMSMRPSTQVRCVVAPVGDVAAVFRPDHAQPDADVAEADRRWQTLSLRGAAVLCRATTLEDVDPAPELVVATDPWLVLNVLARARGSVLMADAAALVDPGDVWSHALASFDPRLVALARRGVSTSEDRT